MQRDPLPPRLVTRLTAPFVRFMHIQAASGVVLMASTVLALILANSSLADEHRALLDRRFTIGVDGAALSYPIWYWVNDGLMTIFFFVIGLEIKRELVWGELRDRRNVVLPACAAIGGAVVPIGLYLALRPDGPAQDGWAVPMATDIAFVVGCLAVLGSRVPPALKVFMLSLAIIDDLLAVIVIAVAFSAKISLGALALAATGLGVILVLDRIGVRAISVYVAVGAAIWVCTLKSGIHPTIAGVILGLLTPATAWLRGAQLTTTIDEAAHTLRTDDDARSPERNEAAALLSTAAAEAVSPLSRLEHTLHPWVAFVIMPVFALVNAGVEVSAAGLQEPIALAVIVGLAVGKPVGIAGATWLAVRAGLARLPDRVSWRSLVGASWLGGIGFTMALFIASLSLQSEALLGSKTGILAGSAISLVCGMIVLALSLPRGETTKP